MYKHIFKYTVLFFFAFLPVLGNAQTPNADFSWKVLDSERIEVDAGRSTGNPQVFEWRVDGRVIGTTPKVEITSDPGEFFDVTLLVRSAPGQTASQKTRNVGVPKITITADKAEYNVGESVRLSVSIVPNSPNLIDSYSPRYGTVIFKKESLTLAQDASAPYEGRVSGPDAAGTVVYYAILSLNGSSDSITHSYVESERLSLKFITDSGSGPNTPPRITSLACPATGNRAACSATAEDDESNSADLTYRWDFGDNTALISEKDRKGATHEYAQSGTFKIKLTVSDPRGATDTEEREVTITQIPPSITLFTCNSSQTSLIVTCSASAYDTETDDEELTYSWDFGDGQTQQTKADATGTTGVRHSYSKAGKYILKLTVADEHNASKSEDKTVLVSGSPGEIPPTIKSITFDPSGPEIEQKITFKAEAEDPDGEESRLVYTWNFGDASTQGTEGATIDHIYGGVGTYTVSLKVTDSAGKIANSQPFNVKVVEKGKGQGGSGSGTGGGGYGSGNTGGTATSGPDHGAGGLVPCNGLDCGFYDLITLANNLIRWLLIITPLIATAMFAYAGWLYLTSGGNPGKVSTAHNIFRKTALGLIIILTAFLIVRTIFNSLVDTTRFWTFF